MFRVVMVPIDGSAWSRHAIPLALAVARPANALLRIVVVLEGPFDTPIYGVPIAAAEPGAAAILDPATIVVGTAAQRDARSSELQDFARSLSAAADVAVDASLEEGQVAGALQRHAAEHDVDLIVMATHGRSGIKRAILGSVADALARKAPCPLLLARPHGELPDESVPASVRHILVLLDGTPRGDVTIEPASMLAALTGARCTLLHVSRTELPSGIVAPDALVDPEGRQEAESAELAHLEQAAEAFRARAVDVSMVVRRGANPAETIIAYASTNAVDLLAVGTHGRAGLDRLAHGSVATELLGRTRLPMLLVHSRG